MKKKSKTILFFGNERLATGVTTAAPTLRGLIEAGYDVAAVVIAQNPNDKSRSSRQIEIAEMAAAHKIPVVRPHDLLEAKHELATYKAEAAVLIAYGKLIPQPIIDLFPKGIINIHPSLLPLHRGSTPLESVILEGASQTGVSLMKLVAEMDAGPVYAQRKIALGGHETKQELADKLSLIGSKMVLKHLPAILDGSRKPKPQDESAATEDAHITKADSLLDWNKPAARLEREIRAYSGWPRSRSNIGWTKVVVTAARVIEGQGLIGNLYIQNKQLGVYTSQGILIIETLIPVGKKEMSGQAFLAGYKIS